jgi:hypothetical protein
MREQLADLKMANVGLAAREGALLAESERLRAELNAAWEQVAAAEAKHLRERAQRRKVWAGEAVPDAQTNPVGPSVNAPFREVPGLPCPCLASLL